MHRESGQSSAPLYRVGGIAALMLGAGYVLIIPLYVAAGAPPTGAAARLTYLEGKATVWWAIVGLSVATDLFYLPLAIALHEALRASGRALALVGASLLVLFVVLDLAITWPNYAALIALSGPYAAATGAQRDVYVAAASYPSAVLESALAGVYAIGVPSVGILLLGIAMRRGIAQRIGYLGIVTGIIGVVTVVGGIFTPVFNTLAILTSALTTIWLFAVGYRLVRFSGA